MKSLRYHNGFSLVELMVVIIIVGILVTVAIPLYLDYTEMCKVREALGIVKAIRTSQKVEGIKSGSFHPATGSAAFTIFLEKGIDVRESGYFIYETTGDTNTFTITATATAKSGITGTISYVKITNSWSCTGDITKGCYPS